MKNLFTNLEPFFRIFTIRTSLMIKIEYLWILVGAIGQKLARIVLKRTRHSLRRMVSTKMQLKIFKINYTPFHLFLTIDEIFQGIHDPEREAILPFERFVEQGMVVCDVGAHIGTHTLKMADRVGSKGKVIALEPSLGTFALLCLNISSNQFSSHVKPIPAALAPRSGKLKLFKHGGSMYSSLVRKSDEFEEVETLTLDTLLREAGGGAIDFMKIDIEGAEEELILSVTKAFQNHRVKALYIDSHIGVHYDTIIEHLRQFNYKYEKIDNSHLFYLDE